MCKKKSIPPEKHYAISVVNEVQEIVHPLKKYNIVDFLYARIFDSAHGYALVTNPEYYCHHWRRHYSVSMPLSPEMLGKHIYYFFTGNEKGPYENVLNDCHHIFKLGYPLAVVDRHHDFYELYLFFTHSDNPEIINFYLNHREIIENFKFYFAEKAEKLMEISERNKLALPTEMQPNFGGLKKFPDMKNSYQQNLLKDITPNYYWLHYKSMKICLTKRQMESIKLLQQGYAIKEIAKKLQLSPRTVEDHLNQTKYKFGIRNKSALIDILSRYKNLWP